MKNLHTRTIEEARIDAEKRGKKLYWIITKNHEFFEEAESDTKLRIKIRTEYCDSSGLKFKDMTIFKITND